MRILEEYSVVKENDGKEVRYFYRLTQGEYYDFPVYGVEIERRDYIGLTKINEEKDSVQLISTQRHKVKQIVMNLCNNEVSPIHLIDILGEFIDENVYEFDILLSQKAQLV